METTETGIKLDQQIEIDAVRSILSAPAEIGSEIDFSQARSVIIALDKARAYPRVADNLFHQIADRQLNKLRQI